MRFFLRVSWLLLPVFLLDIAWAQSKGEPPWEAAKAAIEAWYKKELPESTVEEIAPAEAREILELGLAIRHYARVKVRRADNLRDRDHVAVTFARVAGKWEVDRVKIIGSESLPELESPAEADALRMFREVWKKDKCEGYDINEVKVERAPRFQRELVSGDRAKAKRWFLYELDIRATGNGDFRLSEEGAPYLLKITNGLLWNPADKSWSVDPRWVKCSGFVKQKKD